MSITRTQNAPNRRFISLDEAGEAQYWIKALDTTEAQLRAAIAAVGNQPVNVRRWLSRPADTQAAARVPSTQAASAAAPRQASYAAR